MEKLKAYEFAPKLEKATKRFLTYTIASRSWESIDDAMQICANGIDLVRNFAAIQDSLSCKSYGTIRKFYNETVDLILNGTPRKVNIQSWLTIFADINGDVIVDDSSIGNIGATLVRAGEVSIHQPSPTSLKTQDVDIRLLSYAHCDIITKWISRENGLDDMLFSLFIIANTLK